MEPAHAASGPARKTSAFAAVGVSLTLKSLQRAAAAAATRDRERVEGYQAFERCDTGAMQAAADYGIVRLLRDAFQADRCTRRAQRRN